MTRAPAWIVTAAIVLCLAEQARAVPTYSDPTLVNLFRQVDFNGNFIVNVAYANLGPAGQHPGVTYTPFYAIDGGSWNTQVNYDSANTLNAGSIQISLPQAVTIQRITQAYGGGKPTNYSLLGSTTGFTGMTTLVPSTVLSGSTTVYTGPTTAKYIESDFLGTANSYFQMQEMKAFPPTGTSIQLDQGYNLLAQRSLATLDSASAAGTWADTITQAFDLSEDWYLRGNMAGTPAWFILDLGSTVSSNGYLIGGAAVSYYHGQGWEQGMKIEVSTDKVNWLTPFFTTSNISGSMTIPFNRVYDARYVRVTNRNGSWGALTEFELFGAPIPEPASALLLLAGAAALARRRRG